MNSLPRKSVPHAARLWKGAGNWGKARFKAEGRTFAKPQRWEHKDTRSFLCLGRALEPGLGPSMWVLKDKMRNLDVKGNGGYWLPLLYRCLFTSSPLNIYIGHNGPFSVRAVSNLRCSAQAKETPWVSSCSHLWGFSNVLPSALKCAFPQFPAPFGWPAPTNSSSFYLTVISLASLIPGLV